MDTNFHFPVLLDVSDTVLIERVMGKRVDPLTRGLSKFLENSILILSHEFSQTGNKDQMLVAIIFAVILDLLEKCICHTSTLTMSFALINSFPKLNEVDRSVVNMLTRYVSLKEN